MNRVDQRGASSVVGVLLLVGVTVVIAATVASFALLFVEQTQEIPPRGAFEFEYGNATDTTSFRPADPTRGSDNLTVVYTHGETIPSSRVNITVSGALSRSQNGQVLTSTLVFEPSYKGGGNLFSNTDSVTSGDSYVISDDDFTSRNSPSNLGNNAKLDLSEATVRVYWLSEAEENSAVLAEWTGPEA